MDAIWKEILWRQFGAAIDMLENAALACPYKLWNERSPKPEFWHIVYHTLFFLDLYLYGSVEGFAPPAPFTLDELDPRGLMPERVYTKEELLNYLAHCREKCFAVIETLTEERALAPCKFDWVDMSFAELLLYNMRHVQHHTAQLNLVLRQATDGAPRWIAKAKSSP